MKSRKWIAAGCACLLTITILTGCGNGGVNENVQIDTLLEEDTKVNSQNSEKQGRLMKVVEIDGNQITATIMNFNPGRGQGMGEMPEGPEGRDGEKPERPERKDGEMPEGPEERDGERPERPEGKDGEKPERPEGEVPQDVISENHSGKGEMETVTFTITEETKISQETKSEIIDATLEQIGTDSMIWVELNDNYEAVSIIILESTQNK